MKVDYHIHSNYTRDAKNSISELAMQAKKMGFDEIAITNHFVYSSLIGLTKEDTITEGEMQQYVKECEHAERETGIKILKSLEVDYLPAYHDEIEKFLSSYDLDFVMGVSHYLYVDNHYYFLVSFEEARECFGKIAKVSSIYEKYFGNIISVINSGLFDIIGHIDVVKRYATKVFGRYAFENLEIVKKVADALVKNNVGVEINSSGYRHEHVNETYPSLSFLKIYKEKTEEKEERAIITIGSDAHDVNGIGLNLDKNIEQIREAGFSEISLFDKRKIRFIKI